MTNLSKLPILWKETLFLWGLTALKIPMIFYLRPKVRRVDGSGCVISIPLKRRAKNHMNAMYFGALAVGADCAGGFLAMKRILGERLPVNLVFKDFTAEYRFRAEGETFFVCEEGATFEALLKRALEGSERVESPLRITAYVPEKIEKDPVAEFKLTVSLKKRG